jgi:DNA-binding NarL/FixJ family response regulator
MPSRYLIVEDHPLFAEALFLIARSRTPDAEVTVVSSIKEAITALSRSGPYQMVLFDLRLPDSGGFAGLITLRIMFPKQAIVVFSEAESEKLRERAVIFGATAFVAKTESREDILEVLENVASGWHAELLEPVPQPMGASPSAVPVRNKAMTHQQLRVLQSICNGRQNKQIARELDIAETTIKAHVSEVLRKLSITSRTQAVLEVSRIERAFFPRVRADNFGLRAAH